MTLIQRKISDKMLMYEAILRRLDPNHIDYGQILTHYRNAKKGYLGELRADREWKDMQLFQKHYLFHSFESINQFGHSHQIDTLFLCNQFILVMETKDIGGRIDFDEKTGQLIQTRKDGNKLVYNSPTDQVKRHKAFIELELMKIGINLPVIPIVVFTDASAFIGNIPESIDVFRLTNLRSKLEKLFQMYPKVVNNQQVDYVKEHFECCFHPVTLKRNYPNLPLIKGVICSNCHLQMQHNRKVFYCANCGKKTTNSIYEVLHDYRLLYKEWITNQQFREYVGIESIYTASNMLRKLGLSYTGKYKDRKYFIPHNILDKASKFKNEASIFEN